MSAVPPGLRGSYDPGPTPEAAIRFSSRALSFAASILARCEGDIIAGVFRGVLECECIIIAITQSAGALTAAAPSWQLGRFFGAGRFFGVSWRCMHQSTPGHTHTMAYAYTPDRIHSQDKPYTYIQTDTTRLAGPHNTTHHPSAHRPLTGGVANTARTPKRRPSRKLGARARVRRCPLRRHPARLRPQPVVVAQGTLRVADRDRIAHGTRAGFSGRRK